MGKPKLNDFSDVLTDSDDSYDEPYEQENLQKSKSIEKDINYQYNQNNDKNNDKNNDIQLKNIINGINSNEINNLKYDDRIMLTQCDFCAKFFSKDMIVPEYGNDGTIICFHCLYWVNYKPDLRPFVDGVFGKTIVEYIMETRDSHDITVCNKRNAGGCIVCDHLDGILLENVANNEILINDIDNTNDNEKIFEDEYDGITITI